MSYRHIELRRQVYFYGTSFINRVFFDRDLDSFSHFCSLIRDSSRLAYQLIGYVVDL